MNGWQPESFLNCCLGGKIQVSLEQVWRKEKKKSCFSNIFRELSWWKVLDLKLLKVIFLRENIHFGPRMTKLMTPCSLKLLDIKEKTGVQVSAEATKQTQGSSVNDLQKSWWAVKRSVSETHNDVIITSLVSSCVSPFPSSVLWFCSMPIPIISASSDILNG